jgi:hypothetical protein
MAKLADVLRQTGYSQDGKLTPVAPTAPTLTTILGEHIRTLPQQIEANQRAMDKTMSGMDKYDIFGKPNPNYYPEAMGEFTQNYLPAFMGATAFHGTPHKILGKFDINKVGTGQGAQSYGHGMYFAEAPAVAKEYTESNAKVSPRLRMAYDEAGGDWFKAENIAKEKAKTDPTWSNIANEAKSVNKGNLYKVDIPDEQIPNMMDYHKPLSEQPKAVQDIAMQYLGGLKNQAKMGGYKSVWDLDGADLYGVMQRYQLNDAGKLIKKNVDAKDVSNKLLNSGVPGIKYLDQESLRQTDSYLAKHGGTSNYVVFDPSTVKILEENGKALTRKELIEQQLNKVVE